MMVTKANNSKLIAPLTMQELKDIVFSMNTHCFPGPYGISEKFYYKCWEIIKYDLLLMVFDFFVESH